MKLIYFQKILSATSSKHFDDNKAFIKHFDDN